jgi:hypothetical protein
MIIGKMNLDAIENLELAGYFGDVVIIKIVKVCPIVQNLNLSGCDTITDLAITKIAEWCPMLRSLWLPSSPTITDIAIIRIAECCPRLQKLSLFCSSVKDCPTITDMADKNSTVLPTNAESCFVQF